MKNDSESICAIAISAMVEVTGGVGGYTDQDYVQFATKQCFAGNPYACDAGKTILNANELWHATDSAAQQSAAGARAYLRQTMPPL